MLLCFNVGSTYNELASHYLFGFKGFSINNKSILSQFVKYHHQLLRMLFSATTIYLVTPKNSGFITEKNVHQFFLAAKTQRNKS